MALADDANKGTSTAIVRGGRRVVLQIHDGPGYGYKPAVGKWIEGRGTSH